MLRALWIVAFTLALAGCASDPPRDECHAPPTDDPNATIQLESRECEPIVIQGAPGADRPDEPAAIEDARQRRIAELENQARASQGKDNGTPVRSSTNTGDNKAQLKAEFDARLHEIDLDLRHYREELATLPAASGDPNDQAGARREAVERAIQDLERERRRLERRLERIQNNLPPE